MNNLFWLLLSIALGATGQLFLKMASDGAGHQGSLVQFYCSLATNRNLWFGFISYGLSFAIWMRVLTAYELSYARPMVGLGYVMTVILAIMFLGEKVTMMRWIGILLTVSGIILLNISNNN